jgi:hypothetical protein
LHHIISLLETCICCTIKKYKEPTDASDCITCQFEPLLPA